MSESEKLSPALAWEICASVRSQIDKFGSIRYLDLENEIDKFVAVPSRTDEKAPETPKVDILSSEEEKGENEAKEKPTAVTKKYKPKTCDVCGADFIPHSGRQKTCDICTQQRKQKELDDLDRTVANILAAGDNA
jgi:hypothetical protein